MSPKTEDEADDWLTTREASVLAKVAVQTLANWRALNSGPPYVKLSEGKAGRVRYRRRDLIAWLDERRVMA